MVINNLIDGFIYHPRTGLFRKHRGLISGSYFTNIFGSIINLFIILYVSQILKFSSSIRKIYVHGDDLVLATSKPIDPQSFTRVVDNAFRMQVELEASGYYPPGVDKVAFLGSE